MVGSVIFWFLFWGVEIKNMVSVYYILGRGRIFFFKKEEGGEVVVEG